MLIFPFSGTSYATAFRHCVLIFLGQEQADWPEISSKFGDWTKSNVVPPRTLLIASHAHAQSLASAIQDDSAKGYTDVLAKGQLTIGRFDYSGRITEVSQGEPGNELDLTRCFVCATDEYMRQASQRGDVVVAAPPGFYFEKQSERYASHFLRAESLLSGTSEIELISIALLRRFSEFCEQEPSSATVRIFIDSMAIWPVAQMLAQLHCSEAKGTRRYSIESFRGYEGLAQWQPLPGAAFVIISASTSGGLEAKVRKHLGRTKNVPVVTLLGLQSDGQDKDEIASESPRSSCLFRVPRKLAGEPALDGLRAEFLPDVTSLPAGAESVRVIGERFLSHNNRPKLVRMTHKSLAEKDKRILAELAYAHIVLAGRRKAIGNKWWSLSLDIDALMACYADSGTEENRKLREWIRNYAAPGPTVIIYPKDLASGEPYNQCLAMRIDALLRERAPGTETRVVDHTELERPRAELSEFLKNAAAIVASPIVSNGFVFKQISAMLRIVQPSGPRLYIALAALPESEVRLKELASDIGSNSADSAYRFKLGFALPVGRIDKAILWDEEAVLLNEFIDACQSERIDVPEKLVQRRDAMQASNGLTDTLTFMPSARGEPQPLSAGFLLWEVNHPQEGANFGAGVLLTVATFLEATRRARSGDPDTSLRSGVFQQTLIEPATFTRFNDGAIQAALLRAAYPSELDYAADRAASRDMARLISKFIELHNSPAGSAAPEFVLALLLKKLTLHRDDLSVIEHACTSLTGWLGALARLLFQAK
ncbi:hypothetical protein [Burkholderia ubonensis]|uniref:TIR domain-containing protein n=1 Tax=Burkholderia ubonensis TaxID=101571 RepID=A0ABD4DV11_9BURK|nr:hypothetical protein [Burkholderia ubonensis]KVN76765.1 hypothetical protein WJ68_25280 [Burkholderia ubonensis]KVT41409.1 hypothetical protein WK51_00505 [Burkholderia ubonensis]KVX80947.1 hypothetical protein WL08_12120 [Burkholderia ubonensis]KVZ50680.1 hypothetical protein WL19_14000 [Burkholderia ubonensis]OJA47147.1 hypothetical protein BGV66_13705 [Burkholderia ubonensis]